MKFSNRKVVLFLSVFSLLFISSQAFAKDANYYRVWQGFKRSDVTYNDYMKILPSFMEATVDIYKNRALNQYLVAIPPKNKPDFVPDEFALVALHNEDIYRQIRKTKEGKAYGAAHWDVFQKGSSSSSKMVTDFNTLKTTWPIN
jgi:hypothetical protein